MILERCARGIAGGHVHDVSSQNVGFLQERRYSSANKILETCNAPIWFVEAEKDPLSVGTTFLRPHHWVGILFCSSIDRKNAKSRVEVAAPQTK